MILLLCEMHERPFPDSTKQCYFFCIILFYDIKKHGSALRNKVVIYLMFIMFGKFFVRI